MVKKGIYQHYSGKEIQVLLTALHFSMDEEYVVYKDISSQVVRTQPRSRFQSNVVVGIHPLQKIPRFKFLRDSHE